MPFESILKISYAGSWDLKTAPLAITPVSQEIQSCPRFETFRQGIVTWLLTISSCWPNRTKIKSPQQKVGTLRCAIRVTAVRGYGL
jgi:hypothetical protein